MPNQALNLQDIHLPDGISLFPLAYGWYLLTLLIILLLALIFLVRYYRTRTWLKRTSKTQLKRSYQQYQSEHNPLAYSQRTLLLIKQICALKYPQAMPLSGEALGEFLQQTDACFSPSSLWALTQGLYQKEPTLDVEQLHQDCLRWVRRHA